MAFIGGFPHFLNKEKENLQVEKVRKKHKKMHHNAPESALFPKFSRESMSPGPPTWLHLADQIKFPSDGPETGSQ